MKLNDLPLSFFRAEKMSKAAYLIFFLVVCYSKDLPAEISVSEVINPNGTINMQSHFEGQLNLSGWSVTLDPERGPTFCVAPPLTGSWSALGTGIAQPSAYVRVVVIHGSDVYIGGNFLSVGGNANARGIARWDGTNWYALGTGTGSRVETIAFSGTDIYIGGEFSAIGGNPNMANIARWDGSAWNALGSGLTSPVLKIVIDGSNVYVGGNFLNAGGNPNADYITRWDGSTWYALGTGLNLNVDAMALSGSDLYVGGNFTNAGGNPNADYIARWNGSTWNAVGAGLNMVVVDIVIDNNNIYVGGMFTDAGGNANADHIAKWNGTTWEAVGPGLNDVVAKISISGGNIFASGQFTDAGGNVDGDYVAFWDGNTWNPMGTGLNVIGGYVDASGNDVYVGGWFTDAGGIPEADKIAKYTLTTMLAVELIDFQIIKQTESNLLVWKTTNETNNKGFYVERSNDGKTFESIGYVSAKGYNSSYDFEDVHPFSLSYYRLRQMDTDGKGTFSKVVSIVREGANEITLYPNPANSKLYIKTSKSGPNQIRLFNTLGQILIEKTIENNEIDISSLPRGIYYVELLSDIKRIQKQIIKD